MAAQTISVDSYEPERMPVQSSIVLNAATGTDLGAMAARSHIGWELFCTAAWFIGTNAAQMRPVAANEIFNVPSGTLSGWYAKAAAATPTLIAMGAQKVSA